MPMTINTLTDLLILELQDLYSAEQQIIEAIPKIVSSSSSSVLKEALQNHLSETQQQAKRLEDIAKVMKISLTGKDCLGMKGIIQEGEEIVATKDADPLVKDAALICAAQRVEHYEIAAYGCAIAHAEILGMDDIVDTLEE